MPLSGVFDWCADLQPEAFSWHGGTSQRSFREAVQDLMLPAAVAHPTRMLSDVHRAQVRVLHTAFLEPEEEMNPAQRAYVGKKHCTNCNYERLAKLLEAHRRNAGKKGLRQIDIEDINFQPPGAKALAAALEKTSGSLENLHFRNVIAHKKAARSDRGATRLAGALRHMHKLQEFEFSVQGGLSQAGAWAVEAGLPKGSWGREAVDGDGGDGFLWLRQEEETTPKSPTFGPEQQVVEQQTPEFQQETPQETKEA